MTATNILEKAQNLQEELVAHRRYLHTHPGVGFDLQETYHYVYDQLVQMGYAPNAYGKCGLIASCGHANKGKTILLRADMDALPIQVVKLFFHSFNLSIVSFSTSEATKNLFFDSFNFGIK